MESGLLRRFFERPETRGLSVDDPSTTLARRRILQEKPFLRKIYLEWYETLLAALPPSGGRVLELGSGAAFLKDLLPELLTSEIVAWEGVSLVAEAQRLPLRDASLRGIVMTNVFHHLGDCRAFLREAARTIRPGGVVAMIEPWVTPWSRLVYGHLHHEPFVPEAAAWEFPVKGPLSDANGALPWIVFDRDLHLFEREFPEWRIERIAPSMPVRYLLSGGLSKRSLMPGSAFGFWRAAEAATGPLMPRLAMFASIALRRQEVA
jgi:SAM-dependent methyltransferase